MASVCCREVFSGFFIKKAIVELGEAHATGGEGVDVGRPDFAAVAAQVAEAHVVGHHDDDVGSFGGG